MKWASVKSLFYRNRYFISFLLMLFILRGAIADWNPVPTGSMKPTILEGDVIFVNKLAYSLRLPFSDIELLEHDEPRRGDIVVYNSGRLDKLMV